MQNCIYTNTELCCTPKTNIIWQLYLNKKKAAAAKETKLGLKSTACMIPGQSSYFHPVYFLVAGEGRESEAALRSSHSED